jgi:hypothetical protein
VAISTARTKKRTQITSVKLTFAIIGLLIATRGSDSRVRGLTYGFFELKSEMYTVYDGALTSFWFAVKTGRSVDCRDCRNSIGSRQKSVWCHRISAQIRSQQNWAPGQSRLHVPTAEGRLCSCRISIKQPVTSMNAMQIMINCSPAACRRACGSIVVLVMLESAHRIGISFKPSVICVGFCAQVFDTSRN